MPPLPPIPSGGGGRPASTDPVVPADPVLPPIPPPRPPAPPSGPPAGVVSGGGGGSISSGHTRSCSTRARRPSSLKLRNRFANGSNTCVPSRNGDRLASCPRPRGAIWNTLVLVSSDAVWQPLQVFCPNFARASGLVMPGAFQVKKSVIMEPPWKG